MFLKLSAVANKRCGYRQLPYFWQGVQNCCPNLPTFFRSFVICILPWFFLATFVYHYPIITLRDYRTDFQWAQDQQKMQSARQRRLYSTRDVMTVMAIIVLDPVPVCSHVVLTEIPISTLKMKVTTEPGQICFFIVLIGLESIYFQFKIDLRLSGYSRSYLVSHQLRQLLKILIILYLCTKRSLFIYV